MNKNLFALLSLIILVSMVLAACGSSPQTPEPCSWCHVESEASTAAASCTLEAEGFGAVDTAFMSQKSGLYWDQESQMLSSSDGEVSISIPDGQAVTPENWPDEYNYLQGWSLGNCQGKLYMQQPVQVHLQP
jgi:hypothetical protein